MLLTSRRLIAALALGAMVLAGGALNSGVTGVHAASVSATIQGFKFQPNPLTVTVGTTVTWTNKDTAPHTVTSDTGAFDTGMISPGQSASLTFTTAGTFAIHCTVHPNMHGTIVVQAAGSSSGSPLSGRPVGPQSTLRVGTARMQTQITWLGYYDGRQDTYVNTDVSNKAQAKMMAINFAPILSGTLSASSPMYFVKGRSATGQLAVFGSEPGKKDYSPLWQEFTVSWKAGAKPVLITSDNQIDALTRAGKLTVRKTTIVLNAPIVKVGK